jgi:hypothetical protein
VSTELDQAVYTLLTPASHVIDRHPNDGSNRCRRCGTPWPCFDFNTALGALDLVLRVLNRPGFARGWGSGHLTPLGDGVSIHDFPLYWGHVVNR